jgi:hypothetical protein
LYGEIAIIYTVPLKKTIILLKRVGLYDSG